MGGSRYITRLSAFLGSTLILCGSPLHAGTIHTAIPHINATRNINMCVIDARGKQGGTYRGINQFKQAALHWGLDITLFSYRDANTARADFDGGICDLINLPGQRVQPYNRFSSSLEAPGALPTPEHLRTVVRVLALEKATPLLRQQDLEVVAVFPQGQEMLWLKDPALQAPALLQGKRLAVGDTADDLRQFAKLTGMHSTAFNSSTETTSTDFYQLPVDMMAGSPLHYSTQASGTGGMLNMPLRQTTQQIIAHHSQLPDDFGLHSRQYAVDAFDEWLQPFLAQEQKLPDRVWIMPTAANAAEWDSLFRQVRVQLRNDGVLDPDALTLMRKVRCAIDSTQLECSGGENQLE